ALSQIKEKRYYEKYDKDDAQPNREIYLIGIEFSKEERNISRFEWEQHS
ncbi:MAG: PD-(D/E)XK nuclease domain-containing protein, partial [Thiotrichaceae bacterium]|nr:PD-(D/E)XK nuclease domain-containing protein [Thiotrichaceae bacterium]